MPVPTINIYFFKRKNAFFLANTHYIIYNSIQLSQVWNKTTDCSDYTDWLKIQEWITQITSKALLGFVCGILKNLRNSPSMQRRTFSVANLCNLCNPWSESTCEIWKREFSEPKDEAKKRRLPTPIATRSWQKQVFPFLFVCQYRAFGVRSPYFKKKLWQKWFTLIKNSYLCSRKKRRKPREAFSSPTKNTSNIQFY